MPTLYFFEGLPYFIVNVISVTMFKRYGLSNAELAMYTSLLYLPWVIKPLWSPIVDVVRTKRWWILATQLTLSCAFIALALTLPRSLESPHFAWTMVFFYIAAFASATHDIAADGFYMIALDPHDQSLFVGIRSTFYRIASVFGQGILVVLAGVLELRMDSIPAAWRLTILGSALLLLLFSIYHSFVLDSPESGAPKASSRNILDTVVTFFRKPGILLAMVFLLLFRLPEALSIKMLTPFLLDSAADGGLGLTTAQSGLVYGTIGVVALTLGGILGGVYAARYGLKKSMWIMSLSLALPCAVYLYMAIARPGIVPVCICVALDQFGYGFGFTAYMLYMIHFSEGKYKTSHYALCTAFMALSMMIPGFFAGMIQESVGYVGFFTIVMICCLATIVVTFFARRRLPS